MAEELSQEQITDIWRKQQATAQQPPAPAVPVVPQNDWAHRANQRFLTEVYRTPGLDPAARSALRLRIATEEQQKDTGDIAGQHLAGMQAAELAAAPNQPLNQVATGFLGAVTGNPIGAQALNQSPTFNQYGNAIARGVTRPFANVGSLFAADAMQNVQAGLNAAPIDPNSTGQWITELGMGMIPLVTAATATGGLAVPAAIGAVNRGGQTRADIATLRAQGQEVGGGTELGAMLAGMGLGAAEGALYPIASRGGTWAANRLVGGLGTGLLPATAKFGTAAAIDTGINVAQELVSTPAENLIANTYLPADQQRGLTDNLGTNMLAAGITGLPFAGMAGYDAVRYQPPMAAQAAQPAQAKGGGGPIPVATIIQKPRVAHIVQPQAPAPIQGPRLDPTPGQVPHPVFTADELRRMPKDKLRQQAENWGVPFDNRSLTIPRILDAQENWRADHGMDRIAAMSNKQLWDAVKAAGGRAGGREANISFLLGLETGRQQAEPTPTQSAPDARPAPQQAQPVPEVVPTPENAPVAQPEAARGVVEPDKIDVALDQLAKEHGWTPANAPKTVRLLDYPSDESPARQLDASGIEAAYQSLGPQISAKEKADIASGRRVMVLTKTGRYLTVDPGKVQPIQNVVETVTPVRQWTPPSDFEEMSANELKAMAQRAGVSPREIAQIPSSDTAKLRDLIVRAMNEKGPARSGLDQQIDAALAESDARMARENASPAPDDPVTTAPSRPAGEADAPVVPPVPRKSRAQLSSDTNKGNEAVYTRRRFELQSRIEAGKTVARNLLDPFIGEPWADNHLAGRKPPRQPSPDALGQRKAELQMQLREAIGMEMGREAMRGQSYANQIRIERGELSIGSGVPLEDAIAEAQKLPTGHPAAMILHNLRELEKNPRGTKVTKANTNDLADGSRVVVNDKETLTVDHEAGLIRDGITTWIPEGGMNLYGRKILPPSEAGPTPTPDDVIPFSTDPGTDLFGRPAFNAKPGGQEVMPFKAVSDAENARQQAAARAQAAAQRPAESAEDAKIRAKFTTPEKVAGTGGMFGEKSAPAAKEPWQMTREEYVESKPDITVKSRQIGYVAEHGALRSNHGMSKQQVRAYEKSERERFLREAGPSAQVESTVRPNYDQESSLAAVRRDHMRAVVRAINEGKPVPPEVLADYPDLQPKPAEPAPKPLPAPKTDLFGQKRNDGEQGVLFSARPVEEAGIPEGKQDKQSWIDAARKAWLKLKTESPWFKRWSGGAKLVKATEAEATDFANGAAVVVEAHHGTQRADRIVNRFYKNRSTSGPMPFWTSDGEIAGNYAKGKPDTSIEVEDYKTLFTIKDGRYNRPVTQFWWTMSPEQRQRFKESMLKLGRHPENGKFDPSGDNRYAGNETWEYQARESRGNWIDAAYELWVNGGEMVGSEADFLDVLKAGGIANAEYNDPTAVRSGVYKAYIAFQKPLVTNQIPAGVVSALDAASRRQPIPNQNAIGADAWDKRYRDPRSWIAQLKEDAAEGNISFVWTSVPDWVTRTLQKMGYDGIIDSGGKMGGKSHKVYVPFEPNQIKSATGNRGTFDAGEGDIRFSAKPADPSDIKVGSLSNEVLSRMDRRLKSMGYDSRGIDDVRKMLSQQAQKGKFFNDDWKAAYEFAVGSAESRKGKLASKKDEQAQYKHVEWARLRQLGTTTNPKEAGYIAPGGSMIDLSGKREGGQPGMRSLDHREAGGTDGMQELMASGYVRWGPEGGMLDIAKEPDSSQYARIRQLAESRNGEVVVELEDGLGEYSAANGYYSRSPRSVSLEYPQGTSPTKIIGDIRRFYAGEDIEGGARYSARRGMMGAGEADGKPVDPANRPSMPDVRAQDQWGMPVGTGDSDPIYRDGRAALDALRDRLLSKDQGRAAIAGGLRPATAGEVDSVRPGAPIDAVVRHFGKRVVWFTQEKGSATFLNGFAGVQEFGDTIFINTKSDRPHLAVFGHELGHHMRMQAPDLWRAMEGIFSEQVTEAGYNRYLDQGRYSDPRGSTRIEEFSADSLGDRFTEPEFWRQVATSNPSKWRAIRNKVISWISKVMNWLRGNDYGTSVAYEDLATARSAIARITADYAQRRTGGAVTEPDARGTVAAMSRKQAISKAPWQMTKAEFYNRYYQHQDLRAKDDAEAAKTLEAIRSGGFKSQYPNAVRAYDGKPMDIVSGKYAPRAGKNIYLIPKAGVRFAGNGPHVKDGWRPTDDEVVKASRDNQPLHEAVIEQAIRAGKPVPPEVLAEYPDLASGPQFSAKAPTVGQNYTLDGEGNVDAVRRVMQDEFLPVQRLQEAVTKQGGKLADDSNVRQKMDLFRGKIADKQSKLTDELEKPIADTLGKAKISSDEFDDYLLARHAHEGNAHLATINPAMPDGGTGMTNADASAILAKVAADPRKAQFDAAAAMVDRMNKQTRRLLASSGLLDPAEAAKWEAMYQHYVPTRTNMKEDGYTFANTKTGQGFHIHGPESRRRLGRISRPDSPLTFSRLQAHEAIIRAEKNQVGKAMLQFVRDNPDADLWEVNPAHLKQYMTSGGTVAKRRSPMDELASQKDSPYLAVKVGGKTQIIEMKGESGKLIAHSFKRLGVQDGSPIIRGLGKAMRAYATLLTNYNPEFIIPNLARDVQTAFVNLSGEQSAGMAGRVVKGIPKAWKAVFQVMGDRKAGAGSEYHDYMREYMANGGRISSYAMSGFEDAQASFETLLKEANPSRGRRAWMAIKKAGEYIDRLNGAVETGTRLSAYVEARKAGMSAEKAAALAKNLTVNFETKGEAGPLVNSLWLFSNATIQGTTRTLRSLATTSRGRKIAAGIVASGFAYALLAPAMFGQDEQGRDIYDSIPGKDTHIPIPLPGGRYIKIPKPYGYNVLFDVGRHAGEVMGGHEKPTAAAANLFASSVNAFSPLGGEGSLLQTLSPTLLDPVVQIAENKSWTGQPIVPDQNPFTAPKPDSELANKDTSPILKSIAQWLNRVTGGDEVTPGAIDISPATIEHFMGWATGGVGRFAGKAVDLPGNIAKGDVQMRSLPIASRFLGDVPDVNKREFYDVLREAQDAESDLKHYQETGQTEKASRLQAERGKAIEFGRWARSLRLQKGDAGFDEMAGEFMGAYRTGNLPKEWQAKNELADLSKKREVYRKAQKMLTSRDPADRQKARETIRENRMSPKEERRYQRLSLIERQLRKIEEALKLKRISPELAERKKKRLMSLA